MNGDHDDAPAERPLDEEALVERARRDPEAFAELYRRYVHRVHAFAYRRTGAQHVAEDITSATFERALRGFESFRWRPGGLGPWLFRIAANEVVDHHRRATRESSERALGAAPALHGQGPGDPADEVGGREDAGELMAAMTTLNPRYQQALSLRFLSGLTSDEAAAAMGLPKATMAVVVHRAIGALRRAMAPEARR